MNNSRCASIQNNSSQQPQTGKVCYRSYCQHAPEVDGMLWKTFFPNWGVKWRSKTTFVCSTATDWEAFETFEAHKAQSCVSLLTCFCHNLSTVMLQRESVLFSIYIEWKHTFFPYLRPDRHVLRFCQSLTVMIQYSWFFFIKCKFK